MLKICSQTDVGLMRNNNEDYYFTDLENRLIIVADGAGGHDHGEIASRVAVESCYQYLTREEYLQDTTHVTKTLIDSVSFANQQVIEYKKKYLPESSMGTTLSCVHFGEKEVFFAWIGDSRIYLIDRSEKIISQLSTDHTLYQEMIDRGEIGQYYKKSILSRMLGNNPYTRPDGDKTAIKKGQMILVCSDGLSDLVNDERMLEIVTAENSTLDDLPGAFIDVANGQGGRDNITVSIGVLS